MVGGWEPGEGASLGVMGWLGLDAVDGLWTGFGAGVPRLTGRFERPGFGG